MEEKEKKKLIRQLKKNRIPCYMLTNEEFEVLDSVGSDNRCYCGGTKEWYDDSGYLDRSSSLIYKIKGTYRYIKGDK